VLVGGWFTLAGNIEEVIFTWAGVGKGRSCRLFGYLSCIPFVTFFGKWGHRGRWKGLPNAI